METNQTDNNAKHSWTREEFLAWLERGRKIKEKREKELREWFSERQQHKDDLMESDYYNIEWV